MKIHTILYVLAFAAPALAAPKRKRVFKIYTPEEVRRLETYEDRMLKKTKEPMGSMSMSMPTGYPTKSPKTEWPTKSPKDATTAPTTAPSAEKVEEIITTSAPVLVRPPIPVAAKTTSPVAAVVTTSNPTPAPVEEVVLVTNAPTVSSTTIITTSPTVPENESRDEETSSPTITVANPIPTYMPSKAPISLAPATYAPTPKILPSTVVAPEAPSGAMTLGTAVAAAVVACAMIFV